MKEFTVRILKTEPVTHDVKHFVLEKPEGYTFKPGQATEVSINKPEWIKKKRPFTFTSITTSPHLEFVIKRYTDHHGVTDAIHQLKEGDELVIHDSWGAISYKGEGVFIAGGAGITPFIAILRSLQNDNKLGNNKLIYSNKTQADIILKDELEQMLGKNFINVVTEENVPGLRNSRIDKDYLQSVITDFNQHFYICGPEKFTEAITEYLTSLGAKTDTVIFEK